MELPNTGWLVVTPDGQIQIKPGDPYSDHGEPIDEAVGGEGRNRVRLVNGFAGWVSDVGFVFPEKYPRNPVGACMLASLRALQQPYAGNVVITGWDDHRTELGLIEVLPLNRELIARLLTLHTVVRRALDGRDDTPPHLGLPPEWPAEIRRYADMVAAAEVPTLRLLPPTESADRLRRIFHREQ